ncbi:Flagellar hook-basal body complex protein FliE [Candidatus Sulfopaludibacter sp. SbA3]|nr:Flagellar hook-basal body complex protein FliE [Candidatus Sulfopaludibacter sp. SbA3]
MSPISSITPVTPVASPEKITGAASSPQGGSFASTLDGAIQGIEQPGRDANQAIQNFLSGEGTELHTVALATQRAELAFNLGLQVRNKIVSAYQEVMKMQL